MTGEESKNPAAPRPEEVLHRELATLLVSRGVVSQEAIHDRSAEPFSCIEVAASVVPGVLRFLKEQGRANFLDSITAIDRLKLADPSQPPGGCDLTRRFDVLYQLMLLPAGTEIFVRVLLPEDQPAVPTIDGIFGNANWLERENYDLFGIQFVGSKDLRRILLPPTWEGHPLRRDYVQGDTAVGFPTTRPSPTEAVKNEFAALLAEGEA